MVSLVPGVSSVDDDTDSISDVCLKNSSLRRWKTTSTLLTAKETPFSVNRHGFGSRRIRYHAMSSVELDESGGRTYRIACKPNTEFTLWKNSMIVDNVSDARDDEDDGAWRQIQEVAEVLCELFSENMRGCRVNISIFYVRVRYVYEGSDLGNVGRNLK